MKIKINDEYFNLYVYRTTLTEIINEINSSKIYNRLFNFNILLQGWEYKTVENVGSNIFLEVEPGVVDFISTREVLADTKRNEEFLKKASDAIINFYLNIVENMEISDFIREIKISPGIVKHFSSIKDRLMEIVENNPIYLDSAFDLDFGKYLALSNTSYTNIDPKLKDLEKISQHLKVNEMLDIDYKGLNLVLPLLKAKKVKIFYNVKDDKDKRKVFAYARKEYKVAIIGLTNKKEEINSALVPEVEYIDVQKLENKKTEQKTKDIARIEEVVIKETNKYLDNVILKGRVTNQVLGQENSCYVITDERFYIYKTKFTHFIYRNKNKFKKFYVIITNRPLSLFNTIKTEKGNFFLMGESIDREKYGDYLVKPTNSYNAFFLRENQNFKTGVVAKAIMKTVSRNEIFNPRFQYLIKQMNDRFDTQLDILEFQKEVNYQTSYYIGDNSEIFNEVIDYIELTKNLIFNKDISKERFEKSMDILDKYSRM